MHDWHIAPASHNEVVARARDADAGRSITGYTWRILDGASSYEARCRPATRIVNLLNDLLE